MAHVAIFGAGTMGKGIARVIAGTGQEVLLVDLSEEILKQALVDLGEDMDHEIERWGLTASDKKAILSRIGTATDPREAAECDIILECVVEDLERKRALFSHLDPIVKREAIFVSNTSTLSISELGAATKRPDKVVGMHFPIATMPLVEIVRGLRTSEWTMALVKGFAESLDKKPIVVTEYPGFVTSRIIAPFLNEAMYVVMEGIASADDVDTAMKLAYGIDIGPLALADRMGLDTVMAVMENLRAELAEMKYVPCPLLRKMVRAGQLGRKTGQGFFKYDEEGNRID